MKILCYLLLTAGLGIFCANLSGASPAKKQKIQIALLLDTSNSMDGLIGQAKSQLWKLVNQLSSAKKAGQDTDIEIALFEYGNSNLRIGEGYVRMVSALTTDIDGISEQLFSLTTSGGSEYCGWVIRNAVEDLKWSGDGNDLKMIVLAGNEPFDQGPKYYRESCGLAAQKNIIINTIFCGNDKEGIRTHWLDGAKLGNGQYLNIDQDQRVVHVPTPYDSELNRLNDLLNKTYIGYGQYGKTKSDRQRIQDKNAARYGAGNMTQRVTYKGKRQYRNNDWDLVDATEEDPKKLEKLSEHDLPDEMRALTAEQRKAYLETKRTERRGIQKQIRELDLKMQAYITGAQKKAGASLTLDRVMLDTVIKQAKTKGFEF